MQIALEVAKDNKREFEKVLQYYKNEPLKCEAAIFLIANMIGKGGVEYRFYNSGIECALDTLSFDSYTTLGERLKNGYFVRQPIKFDLQKVSAEFLIENIDLAFKAREKYTWCKALPFDEFCRSVLPYRVVNEPLENWRSFYYSRYVNVVDSLAAVQYSMQEVVFFLNQMLKKAYVHETVAILGYLTAKQIEHIGGGTCDHLALNAVQLMRSFGIPLQFDLLPYHGKVNGGHAYNSFVNEEGAFYYFSPYEREPERKYWIAPLVLRATYKVDIDSYKLSDRLLPNVEGNDVTSQYYAVTEVSVCAGEEGDDVYLSTFNRGSFKAVKKAKVNGGSAVFSDVSCGLLYFPMITEDDQLKPVAHPFIVSEKGEVEKIICREKQTDINGVKLYDAKKIVSPKASSYSLFYWNNGWQFCTEIIPFDSMELNFGTIPKQSLFLIYGDDYIGKMQRPFLIKEGEFVFY